MGERSDTTLKCSELFNLQLKDRKSVFRCVVGGLKSAMWKSLLCINNALLYFNGSKNNPKKNNFTQVSARPSTWGFMGNRPINKTTRKKIKKVADTFYPTICFQKDSISFFHKLLAYAGTFYQSVFSPGNDLQVSLHIFRATFKLQELRLTGHLHAPL